MTEGPVRTEADAVTAFTDLRPLLFSIAYRMLGTVSEAEDVLQEAYLRLHKTVHDGTVIESPKAFLTTVVTRLSLDAVRSARRTRESYVGTWLPEPLVSSVANPAPDPAAAAETADSLSLAFLVVLESLNPVERAVFLLHDVFGFGYDEVAELVERTPENCRQVAVRARRSVHERRPRFEPSAQARAELAQRFYDAAQRGDVQGLKDILAADVQFYGDGGGIAPAAARTVVGVDKVLRLLISLLAQGFQLGMTVEPVDVNGQPGALTRSADGKVISVLALEMAGGRITAIRGVVNPHKLAHLGPVADVRALLRESRGR